MDERTCARRAACTGSVKAGRHAGSERRREPHPRSQRWKNGNDRRAYEAGYNQDGFSHGQGDLASGRGYTPTGSQNYKDDDHGWNSSLGDKNQYRPVYRQAYMEGYQRGYGRR